MKLELLLKTIENKEQKIDVWCNATLPPKLLYKGVFSTIDELVLYQKVDYIYLNHSVLGFRHDKMNKTYYINID